MSRRRGSVLSAVVVSFALAAIPVAADQLWIDVSPASVGTPITIEIHDLVDGAAVDVAVGGFFVEESSRAGVQYTRLEVPGCGGHGAVGEPHMPFRTVLVPAPNGPSAQLAIDGTDATVALTGVTVLPQQPPEPDCGPWSPEFAVDDKAYASDRWFPQQPARIADDVVVRGQRYLVVEVSPLAFNPVRKEVTVRQSLHLTIDLEGLVDEGAESLKAARHSVLFPTAVRIDGATAPEVNPTGIEYLIIADDPLVASVQPLAEWKRLKGLTVEVVAMGSIGTTYSELKAFLQNRYDSDPDLTYVLLAGDHPAVPSEPLSGSYGPYVSDLRLSCLDGSDYLPDIVMGRIAVQSPTDFDNVVAKILAFDRDVVPGVWHGDYLMAAYLQGGCQAERFFFETGTHAMHYIRDVGGMGIHTAATSDSLNCNPYYWRSDASYYNHRPPGYANQPVPQEDADLITNSSTSTQDITDAVNAGVSLVQHRDHGGETGWGDPPFYNSNVNALANGSMTPIVYSINCLTGSFDLTSDCFVDAWMKKYPGGAVGVMAASDISYSGWNDLLVHGSYDSFWDEYDTADGGNVYPHSFRPAEAYLYGKYYMYHWQGDNGDTEYEFELFHWHGDPEMRAYTATPVTPSVTVDPTLPVGSPSLTVTVGTEGALVAVTDNGVLLGRAVASGGVAVVALDPQPQTPTTLDVVVTGLNLVPWQGTVDVIVPVGPWMVHSGHLCDDSAGDGDGIANPGETIVLPVTITNVGVEDGTGITGVLSSGSAHCAVTDPAASFPDAPVGAQVQSLPNHFSFTLDGATPNGHSALLSLDWSASGGYSGASNFAIPVCEHLVISDVTTDFVANDSAMVSWTTNVPATTRLVWGTTSPTTVSDVAGTGTAHAVEIDGLEACTDYVFLVESSSPDCYTAVDDNGGAFFDFQTTAGTPVVVDATDTPVAIPDANTTGASSLITVASPYDVVDVDLLVNITHTYTGDLDLYLIGPDGTTVLLSDQHGGGGNNYTNTHFDDDAATPIGSGSAPFTGSFQPDQPLAALAGQPATGDWTFKVVDNWGADTGTIDAWQLQLTVNEPCDTLSLFADGFESGDTGAWSQTTP